MRAVLSAGLTQVAARAFIADAGWRATALGETERGVAVCPVAYNGPGLIYIYIYIYMCVCEIGRAHV